MTGSCVSLKVARRMSMCSLSLASSSLLSSSRLLRSFSSFSTKADSTGITAGRTSSTKDQRVAATEKWVRTIVVGEKGICPALCPFAPPLLSSITTSSSDDDKQQQHQHELLRIVSSDASSQDEIIQHVAQEVKLLMDVTEMLEQKNALARNCPNAIRTEVVRENKSGIQDENDILRDHYHETTLVVLNETLSCTKNYIDFVRLSWEVQQQAVLDQGYDERHLQLVLFHPKATHQTYGMMMPFDEDDDAAAANYTIRSPFPTIHLLREKDIMKAVTSSYNNDGKLESLPSRNKERLINLGIDLCRQRLKSCSVNGDKNSSSASKKDK